MSGESIEAEIARLTAESNDWKRRAEAAKRAVQVGINEIHNLTAERDAARAEAEHHKAHADKLWEAAHKELSYEPEEKEVIEGPCMSGPDIHDLIESEIERLTRERDGWQKRAEAEERAKQQLADALQTEQQWLIESNEKINVLTEKCDNWQNQSQLHYDNLQRMIRKCDALVAERDEAQVECENIRKDWQEMSVKLEVAEDEVHVLIERLSKEQKVVLQLAEENDLLTLELESRRKAFLQMVVEMGKVSKEMLRT